MKEQKYITVITGLFVAALIISNVASTKLVQIGPLIFDGGTLIFPLTYLFGDILTEIYGYAKTRRIIWTGFASSIIMALTFTLIQILPSASEWPHQAAYDVILGQTPRIVFASIIAYIVGSFVNSFIISKLKVKNNGNHMWKRFVTSTVVAQIFDTGIFTAIAFLGTVSSATLLSIGLSNYGFKIFVEVAFLPLTYWVVKKLKKLDGDHIDHEKENYSPFKV